MSPERPFPSVLCRCRGTAGASDQISDQRAIVGHRRLILQWNDQLPVVGVVVVVPDASALDQRGNLFGPLDLELSQDPPSTARPEDDVVLRYPALGHTDVGLVVLQRQSAAGDLVDNAEHLVGEGHGRRRTLVDPVLAVSCLARLASGATSVTTNFNICCLDSVYKFLYIVFEGPLYLPGEIMQRSVFTH